MFLAVPQIQEMARMNPQQRLELLKEIGGTKVYEERRKESIKVMNETDTKKAQVSMKPLGALRVLIFGFC